jgi:hypothetical protein
MNDTTYYWRVSAINIADTTDWSTVWSFKTIVADPLCPKLKSPDNNIINQDTSLVLRWNSSANAESYNLMVSTTYDFSNVLIDSAGLTANSCSISGLDRNTTCYWKVNAANIADTTDCSTIWAFTTLPPVPDPPELAEPDSGKVKQPISLELSWVPSDWSKTYTLQYSTSPDFTTNVDSLSEITSTSGAVNGLLNDTVYYWRVNATNAAGTSKWSEVWSFKTIRATPKKLGFINLVIIDGQHNPNFIVDGMEFFPDNNLTVFNRWGKKVFGENGFNNDLDFSNYPAGTYYYILNVKMTDGQKQFKSFVDVVKN